MKVIFSALIFAIAVVGCAFAGPLEDAVVAHGKGDYATALSLVRPLAQLGDARAQMKLGFLYAKGQGVPQSYEEAMKWYRLAAAQGEAEAEATIGTMYARGQGVPQDYVEAMKWYQLAAAKGHAGAQNNIGNMYSRGEGVSQDYGEALRWLRKAAAQGDARAVEGVVAVERLISCWSGDPESLVKGCTAVIESGQQTAATLSWAYANRGVAYKSLGRADESLADLRNALEIDPQNEAARAALKAIGVTP